MKLLWIIFIKETNTGRKTINQILQELNPKPIQQTKIPKKH